MAARVRHPNVHIARQRKAKVVVGGNIDGFAEFKVSQVAWFEELDSAQRREYLDALLEACNHAEMRHVRAVATRRTPVEFDPVRTFDRGVCMRIFAMLDPRSLSRAAQVSWQWHMVATLDDIWKPKCVARGWYLPYVPSPFEKGVWRAHYVECVKSWKAIARSRAQELADARPPVVRTDTLRSTHPHYSRQHDSLVDNEGSNSDGDADGDGSTKGAYDGDISAEHRVLRRHALRQDLKLLERLAQHPHAVHVRPLHTDGTNGTAEPSCAQVAHGKGDTQALNVIRSVMETRLARYRVAKQATDQVGGLLFKRRRCIVNIFHSSVYSM